MNIQTFEQFKHEVHSQTLNTLNERHILSIIPQDNVLTSMWQMYIKSHATIEDIVLSIVVESTHIDQVFFPIDNSQPIVPN